MVAAPGHAETLFSPEMSPDDRQGIAESWLAFAIPGAGGDAAPVRCSEPCRKEGYERKQAEQTRGGARDGPI